LKIQSKLYEAGKIYTRIFFYFFEPASFSRENKLRKLKLPFCVALEGQGIKEIMWDSSVQKNCTSETTVWKLPYISGLRVKF
jgi:hypothetical protein